MVGNMLSGEQFDKGLLHSCGKDVYISPYAVIKRPELVDIGDHVAIDAFVYIAMHDSCEIGDYVHVAPYVSIIGSKFKMGHFTTVTTKSTMICTSDEHLGEGMVGPTAPKGYRDKLIDAPIILENFASCATNVTVLPGVTLREGSVAGACSLVTKSTDPWGVYIGIPAVFRKWRRKEKMLQIAKELGYL